MSSVDYSRILKRSWQLSWKNKWLWVYGLILAIFGGSGGSGGGAGFSSSDFKELINSRPLPDTSEPASQVLGMATNAIADWFKSVPLSIWLILAIGLILLLTIGFTVGLIIRAWAKAALISALHQADSDQSVNLVSTSPSGLTSLKSLIIYGILVSLIALAGVLVLLSLGSAALVLKDSLSQLVIAVFLVALVLSFLFFMILLGFTNIYAERLIVLKNFSPWAAWKTGLNFAYHKFFPTLTMGIVDRSVGCSVGCLGTLIMGLFLGLPAYLLLTPSFKNGFHWPSPPNLVAIVLLFLIFIHLNLLLQAIFTVFNFSNWNLFVKEMETEEKSL
ncbi:hypothetical protein A3D85_03320 [Candidatus Amesbacteria bacterium RIFCSPHIGHO2_02_FULL_47_9]|uniref:DUF4013 domain-containing protein n=1 Tax=Candidatus Amesbacteria bacterium RIFCSPHIGHO2_01_FULL_48_32b TaxID=1797253 RepID=A0A1F4YGA7_9BACT|nr:MAG: hypothetical protein A2876_00345 [Candidatus Amesbacteria bacterium RIFCSPHIGHO2_01_FULL_48_32b]OGD04176.1 MAG: hypothetical protein A3D85_03320 [Candidatus Amesbacteria bacterium RIFCSPHIGHO2_02_FULL_47_9]OGD07530.1 MAG: hypothetical protein A2899_04490 [Candidatus Amesbacteria bacterium RIFCSPLOWO2_01_FULL_49_25]